MFARFALAGGAITPPIPTITYGTITNSGTQITATITNFSSEFGYAATSNVGTLSRSGSAITVTGLTTGSSINIVVIATSAKGLSTPSSAVTDRQPYTFRTETRTGTRFVDTTSCYTASPTAPQCPFGGVPNVAGTECCIASGFTEEFTFTVQVRNDAPAGYLDSGFDWYRVGNVTIERTPYTFFDQPFTFDYPCSFPCQVPCSVPTPPSFNPCCSLVPGTPESFRCTYGQTCFVNPSGGQGTCPSLWVCSGGLCYNNNCIYTPLVCQGCSVPQPPTPSSCPSTCSGTCQGSSTRSVRNPIPPGYLDSGVDWYRFV
jgi:hypothetical protein